MSTTTIPVTVDPEAADLVTQLGMQTELDRMLEQARQMIPGLRRLQVVFAPPYDTGPDPSVVIEAYRDPSARQPNDSTWDLFSRWKITTFPPEVCWHFTLLIMDENHHGG